MWRLAQNLAAIGLSLLSFSLPESDHIVCRRVRLYLPTLRKLDVDSYASKAASWRCVIPPRLISPATRAPRAANDANARGQGGFVSLRLARVAILPHARAGQPSHAVTRSPSLNVLEPEPASGDTSTTEGATRPRWGIDLPARRSPNAFVPTYLRNQLNLSAGCCLPSVSRRTTFDKMAPAFYTPPILLAATLTCFASQLPYSYYTAPPPGFYGRPCARSGTLSRIAQHGLVPAPGLASDRPRIISASSAAYEAVRLLVVCVPATRSQQHQVYAFLRLELRSFLKLTLRDLDANPIYAHPSSHAPSQESTRVTGRLRMDLSPEGANRRTKRIPSSCPTSTRTGTSANAYIHPSTCVRMTIRRQALTASGLRVFIHWAVRPRPRRRSLRGRLERAVCTGAIKRRHLAACWGGRYSSPLTHRTPLQLPITPSIALAPGPYCHSSMSPPAQPPYAASGVFLLRRGSLDADIRCDTTSRAATALHPTKPSAPRAVRRSSRAHGSDVMRPRSQGRTQFGADPKYQRTGPCRSRPAGAFLTTSERDALSNACKHATLLI
ncbi:hypothetical protein FB451DRAFT_1396688 [Mycena latifolia]|nr:hypothetical protein FB451DRAFT_1396688 [Mycena latifolia]